MPAGRSPTQLPTGLRLVLVTRRALWLAGPDRVPVALHWPPPLADRSKERKPSNPSAVAKPLMAPLQSPVELTHAPSTQLVVCATFTVIVLVEKFADSMVPVHAPERSANGPAGGVGEGAPGVEPEVEPWLEPQALATQATTIAPATRMRLRTTKDEYLSRSSPACHSGEGSRAGQEQEPDHCRATKDQEVRVDRVEDCLRQPKGAFGGGRLRRRGSY